MLNEVLMRKKQCTYRVVRKVEACPRCDPTLSNTSELRRGWSWRDNILPYMRWIQKRKHQKGRWTICYMMISKIAHALDCREKWRYVPMILYSQYVSPVVAHTYIPYIYASDANAHKPKYSKIYVRVRVFCTPTLLCGWRALVACHLPMH